MSDFRLLYVEKVTSGPETIAETNVGTLLVVTE